MMDRYMTKDEAIQAMRDGHKVTHRYFSREEFIYAKNGELYDENEYLMKEFWRFREGAIWDTGWSLYKDDEERLK